MCQPRLLAKCYRYGVGLNGQGVPHLVASTRSVVSDLSAPTRIRATLKYQPRRDVLLTHVGQRQGGLNDEIFADENAACVLVVDADVVVVEFWP